MMLARLRFFTFSFIDSKNVLSIYVSWLSGTGGLCPTHTSGFWPQSESGVISGPSMALRSPVTQASQARQLLISIAKALPSLCG